MDGALNCIRRKMSGIKVSETWRSWRRWRVWEGEEVDGEEEVTAQQKRTKIDKSDGDMNIYLYNGKQHRERRSRCNMQICIRLQSDSH